MIGYYNRMKKYQNRLDEIQAEVANITSKMNILKSSMMQLLTQSTNYERSVIQQITSGFNNLMAVMNAFPNLNGNAVFIQNYQEMEKLEVELQQCLNDYNGIVKNYNDGINTFPAMILAFIFSFKKRNYAKRF
ncbi:MAG: LemA family protein [Bacteroidetes bacterium]|nr:LemA family protein [Bacteroidota bacterium]